MLKNYCPEIYHGLFVDQHNDDLIRVSPCCQSTSSLEPVNTFNFTTSPYLTQLRNEFNLGQKPLACTRCWNAEELGYKSRRQSMIEFFKNQTTEVNLESIDHNATWACNLACIMCNPQSSSLWAAQENVSKNELLKLGRHFQRSNNFLEGLDVSHIKKIHFNGGEPMLNNDQTNLLLKLEQQGVLENVFISYNTNGTVMPSKKIIDLWGKARLVKIFFSIDAIGSAFEYIRWPGNWEQTSKNILDMKANLPGNVMFGFNTTVGSYNLLELTDVYQWFDQNLKHNREGDESDFCWQLANNFDIKYLPLAAKLEAIQQMNSISSLNGVTGYIKSTINHHEDASWINTLNRLDIKRNTNWRNSLKVHELIGDKNC